MNFLELRTAVVEDTHRPDLVNLIPRFVREGEGMIRREMTAYLLTTTLDDTARVVPSEPIYNLPGDVLIIRRLAPTGVQRGLDRISLDAIGAYELTARVRSYAEAGDGTIEIRGNPGTGATFVLNYYGMPAALVDDTDTNALLDENETLYKAAAMFYVYQHTQDRELAGDSLQVFNTVLEPLNEQIARKIGGTQITPSYNFNGGSTY